MDFPHGPIWQSGSKQNTPDGTIVEFPASDFLCLESPGFVVIAGDLGFSVTVFCICALVCIFRASCVFIFWVGRSVASSSNFSRVAISSVLLRRVCGCTSVCGVLTCAAASSNHYNRSFRCRAMFVSCLLVAFVTTWITFYLLSYAVSCGSRSVPTASPDGKLYNMQHSGSGGFVRDLFRVFER